MSGTVQKLSRPNVNFRSPTLRFMGKWTFIGLVGSTALGVVYWWWCAIDFKKRYDTHWKTLDRAALVERNKRVGIYKHFDLDGVKNLPD